MQTMKYKSNLSLYQHYLSCCETLGIPNVQVAVDQMLSLDFMVVNEDRHQNNFGVIRDANTLEWIGAAPIFDSGTSMWYDKPLSMIRPLAKQKSKLPMTHTIPSLDAESIANT
jgi:hypothetical protein